LHPPRGPAAAGGWRRWRPQGWRPRPWFYCRRLRLFRRRPGRWFTRLRHPARCGNGSWHRRRNPSPRRPWLSRLAD